jgi:stage V sporulation protein G
MEITEVRVSIKEEERLKAFATIIFDDCFVVRHLRIVRTEKGLLVSMPSRKLPDGTHKDIAHPITHEFRKKLEDRVLAEYEAELKRSVSPSKNHSVSKNNRDR